MAVFVTVAISIHTVPPTAISIPLTLLVVHPCGAGPSIAVRFEEPLGIDTELVIYPKYIF
ncbi:hypothetical protein EA473_21650 [Natrarchaeobius chitinivorans]|uniref:Uncharacterized protein n=1 Tax=Natrarchaeobius chitinivorans TaxID=1679083 RepID=A0A3N6NY03_NATCH|nr:hypothetical protein EA473_21650 [Natrarchaeobius chitinivorans]